MPRSTADPNGFIAVGMQTALGTPQSTATKFRFIKYLASDFAPDANVVDLREGGDGLDFGSSYKDKQVYRGNLQFNARPEAAGQILQLALGGATWDGASGPAAHYFHSNHASFPYFTFLAQHPASDLMHRVTDALFTGLTIEGQSGQPWKYTLPFIGINHGASFAALVPSYAAEQYFLYHGSPTYVVDGVADTTISGFNIQLGLGVDELQAQAITLDALNVLTRDVNVTLNRRFENPGLWQKIYYGASGNLAPTTAVATGNFRAVSLYGAGAALRSLDLGLPLLSYRSNQYTGIDPDGKTVMETITAKSLSNASGALNAVLKNAHASAYAG